MANQKMSQLPEGTSISPEDIFPFADITENLTKKITFSTLTASMVLNGDLGGVPGSNYIIPGAITDAHVSQSANISWSKINFAGSSVPTGQTYGGTASWANSASVASFAQSYDLNYISDTIGQFTYRNKLINGNFTVWQRGTSFPTSVSSSAIFGWSTSPSEFAFGHADRWIWQQNCETGSVGAVISKETSDLPVAYGSNVPSRGKSALKVEVSLGAPKDASLSMSTGSYFTLMQNIEGQACQNLVNGPMVLSFWAKTTHPFSVSVRTETGVPYIHTTDLWDNSGTWIKYELPVAKMPDVAAAAFNMGTAFELKVVFTLGAGYNFSGGSAGQATPIGSGSWVPGFTSLTNRHDYLRYFGVLVKPDDNVYTNKVFKIAQVQLESGTTATQYEVVPISDEKTRCQRYLAFTSDIVESGVLGAANVPYILGRGGLSIHVPFISGSGEAILDPLPPNFRPMTSWKFPSEMRAAPTLRSFNAASKYYIADDVGSGPYEALGSEYDWLSYYNHLSGSAGVLPEIQSPTRRCYLHSSTAITPESPSGIALSTLFSGATNDKTTAAVVGIDAYEGDTAGIGTYFVDLMADADLYS